ncbi:MAG: hypothetical protein ACTSPI_06750 [Candidatus Heimdallarchaeaceae archaeon]
MNKLDLYKELGSTLIEKGKFFLTKAFDLKDLRIISKSYLTGVLNSVGLSNLYYADAKYYVPTLNSMKDIIKYSWTDKKQYQTDQYDCDDYALSFRAFCSELFGINTVALAKSIKVTTNTGKEIWHRACIFLAEENGVISAYLLETQNDRFIKLEKGISPTLGTWKYNLANSLIEF